MDVLLNKMADRRKSAINKNVKKFMLCINYPKLNLWFAEDFREIRSLLIRLELLNNSSKI